MKQTTLLILVTAFTLPAWGTLRMGNTPARRIAKDMSLPGQGVDGQCLPFARALHARFRSAGIPSKVIVFRYESLGRISSVFSNHAAYGLPRPQSGAHAIVAYNDGGRIYVTDHQTWMPQWVQGDSAIELARQFGGMDNHVTDARVASGQSSRVASASGARKSSRMIAASRTQKSRLAAAKSRPKSRIVAAKNFRSTSKSSALAGKNLSGVSKSRGVAAKHRHSAFKSRAIVTSTARPERATRKGRPTPARVFEFRGRPLALR